MNRREFLKGAAVAAGALGAGAASAAAKADGRGAVSVAAEPWLEADVLVAGGGPAGVCAAVSAAREGAKTILVERFGCLGGNLTLGHVSPILGKVSPGTMADEIRRLLNANHLDAKKVMTRNGPEEHIDHEEAKGILAKLCADAGVTILLCATVVDAVMEGARIVGAVVDTPKGLRTIRAKCVVDATGDGRVAVCAGAEAKIGRDSDGGTQPSTLEFVVDNVDESQAITAWGGTDPVRLPSGEEYRELCKRMNRAGELPENVTIVRLHRTFYPGERSVNATQLNGADTLDPVALGKAEVELRSQIDRCVAFLRKHVPGYGDCRVKSSAGTLGVRESRRITGDAQVVDADLLEGRKHPDAVVHDAWFLIDIHNPKGGGQAEGHSHPAKPYDIRYGAFLPKGVEGLLTAGRCISGTHRAHASYRVMTPCMAMGEAVGVAAALAVKSGRTPRQVAADEIRAVLASRGVALDDVGGVLPLKARLAAGRPFFIAHRGRVLKEKGVRENTIASFEEAGRAGLQAIETDVRLTADGALVCSHDANLKRVFGVDLDVGKSTLAEVRRHPVPTFDEYLDVCAKYDAVPFVETKGDKRVVAPVLDVLRRRGLVDVAVMSAVPFDHIRETRRLDRRVFVHHIFSKPELLDELAAMGNAGLSWNYADLSKLPPDLVARTHAKGVKCCLRACDTPEALVAMRRLGLDYFPTNRMTPDKED